VHNLDVTFSALEHLQVGVLFNLSHLNAKVGEKPEKILAWSEPSRKVK